MILLRKHNQIQNSIWPSTSDMNFPDIWRHRTFGGIEDGTTVGKPPKLNSGPKPVLSRHVYKV